MLHLASLGVKAKFAVSHGLCKWSTRMELLKNGHIGHAHNAQNSPIILQNRVP